MQRFLKISKKTFLTAIIIIIILAILNWEKVNRLHSVITLFDSKLIVNNFSNMNKSFITQSVQKSDELFEFETSFESLPKNFFYREKSTSVDEFITRRATTALLVLKNDQITYENYFLDTQPKDKRISWSMAKSFVSVLFGMQVDEGKIDIEKSVGFYLSEMKGSGYENVKVKHVLQMSSGVK